MQSLDLYIKFRGCRDVWEKVREVKCGWLLYHQPRDIFLSLNLNETTPPEFLPPRLQLYNIEHQKWSVPTPQNVPKIPPTPGNSNTLSQAPTRPSKRASIRSKISRPATTPTTTAVSHPIIQPRKKDKLQARHTTFVTKIEKSATKNSARSRRRQKKAVAQNLVTGLGSLADALDDALASESMKFQSASSKAIVDEGIGRKSMKSRPGAMKRKEKVVKTECERFGKNLAIMQTGLAAGGQLGEKPSSWAALRNFIAGTMEQKEEFVKDAQGAVAG